MPNPVVHWEVAGKNAKRLHDFYSKLFGWHVDANNPMDYGLVDTQAGGINGGIPEDPAGGTTIYVEVDDLQAYLDKAAGFGGSTEMPVTVTPNMVTMAKFVDPEGNVVGLVKSETPS